MDNELKNETYNSFIISLYRIDNYNNKGDNENLANQFLTVYR